MSEFARASRVRPAGSPPCLVLAILLAALPSALAAEDAVRLRYRLRPATSYEQTMTMDVQARIEFAGLSAEQAAELPPMLTQPMQQKLKMRSDIVTGAAEADGSLPVEYRVGDLEARITVGGQEIAMPLDPASKLALRGKLAPDGRVISLELGEAEDLQGMPSDLFNRFAQMMPAFPDGEMKVGESVEMQHPAQTMKLPLPESAEVAVEGKTVFTLRSIGEREALFDLASTVRMAADAEAAGGANIQLDGGGRGSATFDTEEGIFTRMRLDLEMHMQAHQPPGDAGAAAPSIRLDVQGPLVITVSRAAGAS